jgi:hypothetical protein
MQDKERGSETATSIMGAHGLCGGGKTLNSVKMCRPAIGRPATAVAPALLQTAKEVDTE